MNRKKRFILFVNSSTMILAAFFSVHFFLILLEYGIAHVFSIRTELSLSGVKFTTADYSYLWNHLSITAIHGLPIILALTAAIISEKQYHKIKRKPGLFKLYYIWTTVFLYMFSLGGIAAGLITQSKFVYFLNWMYVPLWIQIIIGIAALAFLYFRGSFQTFAVLQTSPKRNFIAEENQKLFKRYAVYLPAFALLVFLNLYFLPKYSLYLVLLSGVGFLLLIIKSMQTKLDAQDIKLVKSSKLLEPQIILLVLTVGFLLAFKLIILL